MRLHETLFSGGLTLSHVRVIVRHELRKVQRSFQFKSTLFIALVGNVLKKEICQGCLGLSNTRFTTYEKGLLNVVCSVKVLH
jgi:hypothetical protein